MFIFSSSYLPRTLAAALFTTSLALGGASAFAQSADASPTGPKSGGIVGVGVASAPAYRGADHQRTSAMPMVNYHWSNGVFIGGDALVGYQFSQSPALQYGVMLNIGTERKESDSTNLAGMGDVLGNVEYGGFVKAMLSESWAVSSALQVGSGSNHQGAQLRLGTSYTIGLSPALQLSLNLGATAANSAYMNTYFGVSDAQSVSSGYKAYSASGGFRDVSAGVRLNYQISPKWILSSGITSSTLVGTAKDSPLVRKNTSTLGFLGVGYVF
jgi:outer membrane protein